MSTTLPPPYPPAASLQTMRQPASTEKLGAVSSSLYTSNSPVYQRRQSPYILSNSNYSSASASASASVSSSSERNNRYSHNVTVAIFMLPPLFLTLWNHVSPYPLQTFLYLALAIYAMDMANLRDLYVGMCFFGAIVMMMVNGITALSNVSDDETAGFNTSLVIMKILCDALLFICMACWATVQAEWLYKSTSMTTRAIENSLHSLLVPLSVALTLLHMIPHFIDFRGPDDTAKLLPYIFSGALATSMLSLGSLQRSGSNAFIIRPKAAKLHITILLLAPPLMFTVSFYQRIFSKSSLPDVWLDLILVWCIPYLLLYSIQILTWNNSISNPYQFPILFGRSATYSLRGSFIPILVSLLSALALEFEYLIPLCRIAAYNFSGHASYSNLVLSLIVTAALLVALFAGWVHKRSSSNNGEVLFGEYHDDVVQLSLAFAGLLIGKAVGMPWSLTPLPILALLGTIIWLNTRMLRYLAMLLFVFHSTAMVLWSYRYAGIETKIDMVFGLQVTLFQFGMLIVGISLLVFLVMGLAVRSSGGIGHGILRRFDICGLCFLFYVAFESVMECILLKYPLPFHDLMGIEVHEHPEDHDFLYQPFVAYVTSLALCGLSIFLQHFKIVSPKTAMPSLSLALGKALAVFIDTRLHSKSTNKTQAAALSLLLRCLAGALLIFATMAPRFYLSPVHFKVSGGRKSFSRQAALLPSSVHRIIMLYGIFLYPLTLIISAPFILRPLVGILSGQFGAYYTTEPVASETLGWACALWGLAILLAINRLLPDGGGELWNKTAALAFLMGLVVALAAPTVPAWMLRDQSSQLGLNPFAFLSSQSPLKGRSSHASGWGLLSAALATLLAITGPLDLKERPERGDRYLLLRTMLFSILFGCGIAWFITLESMNNEDFLPTFSTATACMAMSFFGTVGGVLSFSLELKDFREAEQILIVWIGAFPVFLLTAASSQLVKSAAHPFGIGGWLSTYLSVCGTITLALCLTLRARSQKNSITRGVANSSCSFSWLCWVIILFGRYGVAGMDADFSLTTFFGIPASVLGTVIASSILLLLEGEHSANNSNHGYRNNHVSGKPQSVQYTWMSLNFHQLSKSNRLAPLLTAISAVLVCASLYSIILRGVLTAATPENVYESIFNESNGADDLASLARKNLQHRQAIQIAAKLSGTSFWTASNPFTPILFLAGVFATFPSIYGFIHYLWSATVTTPMKSFTW
eukprot:CAMPEP_0194235990 /NCGR_PEP_ID=MMETSP0158-20130606/3343_1 /TAXON_ID=33649 /ORGANISM="Thalassionema nitzschioides, Strain L26-B" /LENGTH=1209 /DNA_ID=CAMNT_0038969619 /DNA_START=43 /DNA_END=3669 /DNA_ORIENTATION=+